VRVREAGHVKVSLMVVVSPAVRSPVQLVEHRFNIQHAAPFKVDMYGAKAVATRDIKMLQDILKRCKTF